MSCQGVACVYIINCVFSLLLRYITCSLVLVLCLALFNINIWSLSFLFKEIFLGHWVPDFSSDSNFEICFINTFLLCILFYNAALWVAGVRITLSYCSFFNKLYFFIFSFFLFSLVLCYSNMLCFSFASFFLHTIAVDRVIYADINDSKTDKANLTIRP